MKRRTLGLALSVLIGASMVVFFFAPIVYSPIYYYGGPIIAQNNTSVCAAGCTVGEYKSLSCEVLGAGLSFGHWMGNGWDDSQWFYRFGCPPQTLPTA